MATSGELVGAFRKCEQRDELLQCQQQRQREQQQRF